MKKDYTTDEIKAIVDGEPANDAPVEEVGRYYYDEIDQEKKFRPYTMDEINAMLDRAEAHLAAGLVIPGDVVMRELREEFAREDAEEEFRPYTMDEIHAMLDRSEADFAAGRGIPSEVVFRHLREDLQKALEGDSILREAV